MKRLVWLLVLSILLSMTIGTAFSVTAAANKASLMLEGYLNDNFIPLAANYVGNSNTHKFHYYSCRYVAKIYDSHKVYFNTRDEAINSGYIPCKVCKP